MAKHVHVGERGGIASWREAHDAMGEQLEAAEGADADAGGKVAVDFAACRDGYGALAGMFAPQSGGGDESRDLAHRLNRDGEVDHRRDFEPASDSRRGMALDARAVPPILNPRQAAAQDTIDAAFSTTAHAPRNRA